MRAIMVAVDYCDLLAITLPYNRHHFDEVMVVTSLDDLKNVLPIAQANRASVFATDSFYAGGARFNKWRALEEGLDEFGRKGWICLMDADVLWPKSVRIEETQGELSITVPQGDGRGGIIVGRHQLCSPLRRMCDPVPRTLPQERDWGGYPIHRNVNEWAGYSQIFHASDPALGVAPWHDVNFTSAGTSDSFFQQKWPPNRKVRPPWECLHLGPAGQNWMGRVSPYLNGGTPIAADARRKELAIMLENRRGKSGRARFEHERLKGNG